MKIYKTISGIVIHHQENYYSTTENWDNFTNRPQLYRKIQEELASLDKNPLFEKRIESELVAPVGTQEVWAAGVTYYRSKEARMDESKESGGATFYDKVYEAERPELFFKANPIRVAGHQQAVNIRKDSTWNVPEPELTLFISSGGTIEGYTIGNDMSSRSIEGENPLYLPQAKTYQRSAALGPCLLVPERPISPTTEIHMEILREGKLLYKDHVAISKMKRTHTELASFLFRECDFPTGCFLMTGTCLVPTGDFTLHVEDVVSISIDGIGTLTNKVSQRI
jgi:2-dehydro-3-deoxy-D-arabinonate dehydratase